MLRQLPPWNGGDVSVYLGMLSSGWSSWHSTAQVSYIFLWREREWLLDQHGPVAAPDYHQEFKGQYVSWKRNVKYFPYIYIKEPGTQNWTTPPVPRTSRLLKLKSKLMSWKEQTILLYFMQNQNIVTVSFVLNGCASLSSAVLKHEKRLVVHMKCLSNSLPASSNLLFGKWPELQWALIIFYHC